MHRLNPSIKAPLSLRTAVRVIALAAVFCLSMLGGYAAIAAPTFTCADHKKMIKHLLGTERQAYMATAIEDHQFAIQLFMSPRTGNFTILGIDDNQTACVLMRGTEFQFAIISDSL